LGYTATLAATRKRELYAPSLVEPDSFDPLAFETYGYAGLPVNHLLNECAKAILTGRASPISTRGSGAYGTVLNHLWHILSSTQQRAQASLILRKGPRALASQTSRPIPATHAAAHHALEELDERGEWDNPRVGDGNVHPPAQSR